MTCWQETPLYLRFLGLAPYRYKSVNGWIYMERHKWYGYMKIRR